MPEPLRSGAGWMLEYLPTKRRIDRINNWLAVIVTDGVATMWCAYAFTLIALVSLPATLVAAGWLASGDFPSWMTGEGLIAFIGWVSSYFIQLVLLSVIMVGQKVQARQSEDVKQRLEILDRLDPATPGGIADVLARVQAHLDSQDAVLEGVRSEGKDVEQVLAALEQIVTRLSKPGRR